MPERMCAQDALQSMKNEVLDTLATSQRTLESLGQQLRQSPRRDEAAQLFRQYALALGAHLGTVNKAVFPALQGLPDEATRETQTCLMLGHAKLAHCLAELLTFKVESAAFVETLADLLDATAEVIACERDTLLPLLQRLDRAQLLSMALDAQAYLPAAREPEPDPANVRFVSEWLEEARLLLGSVPTETRPPQSASA
jgi:hypothetical protein